MVVACGVVLYVLWVVVLWWLCVVYAVGDGCMCDLVWLCTCCAVCGSDVVDVVVYLCMCRECLT